VCVCFCGDSESGLHGVSVSPCKSSVEDVPLRAKPAINFHDAVFYYPPEPSADDDDQVGGHRGLAHVFSEGRVPGGGVAACSSSELPLKEAASVGDDAPLMGAGTAAASRGRRPSVLRRMRAFFARSGGGSGTAGDDETPGRAAGRQLSAADTSMTSPAAWTELDEAQSVPAAVGACAGGVQAADDPVTARPAVSDTSPQPTAGYKPPPEQLMTEAEQLRYSPCELTLKL